MAKKRETLRVAMTLDLDDYAKGLSKAKTEATTQGAGIGTALNAEFSKVATRLFAIDKAIDVAGKALKAFGRTAEDLEKKGQGNEGTAAYSRLTAAVDGLQKTFVKAVLETKAAQTVIGFLTEAVSFARVAILNWDGVLEIARGHVDDAAAAVVKFVDDSIAAVQRFFGFATTGSDQKTGPNTDAPVTGDSPKPEAARLTFEDLAQKQAIEDARQLHEQEAQEDAISKAKIAHERAAQFQAATTGLVDTMVHDWTQGFERLAIVFHNFSAEVSDAFDGMRAETVDAIGDVFESIAFTGPLVEQVFGRSAKVMAVFQAVEMALVARKAIVKGVEQSAAAYESFSDYDFIGGAGHTLAAAGYFSAAGLAGVSASQGLGTAFGGSGGGPGFDRGMTNPDSYSGSRRNVNIQIENIVGSEQFVRDEVIPAINAAVNEDQVVMSTHSNSTDAVDPGRFRARKPKGIAGMFAKIGSIFG